MVKLFDPVFECNPLDDLWYAVCPVEFAPFSLRRHHQLERHSQTSFATEASLGFSGTMSNSGEGAFNRIGRADVLPVFGWEVIEGQENVAVFGHFADGLIVFDAIGCDEEVERSLRIHPRLRLPDVVQVAFGLGLNRLGHRVQYIARFVEPAALLFRGVKDLAQRIPEAQGTITDGKIRGMGKTTPLEIKEQLTPALGAFAVAIRHADDFLAAPLICSDEYQNTLFFLSHSWSEVDTIRPDIDEPPRAEIAPLPAVVLIPSVGLEARDCRG